MFNNDIDKLDQHFLIDKKIISKVIEVSNLKYDDVVVEVGSGNGVLTKEILPKVKYLYVIKKDKRLKNELDKLVNKYNNLNIIYDNVLDTYIPNCNKLITSLPYSIIEPFIKKIINANIKMVIMIVGKKYADGLANNNKISILTRSFYNYKKVIDINKEAFKPSPRVYSSLLILERKEDNDNNIKDYIFRYLYYYRDMKIKNALIKIFIEYNNMTQKESKEYIKLLNIDEDILEDKYETIDNNKLEKLYMIIDNIKYF